MSDTAIQVSQPSRAVERAETFAPRSLSEAFQFASMVLESGMAPKSYLEIYNKAVEGGASPEVAGRKAESAVVVALQFGLEVGFQPMQALQCIANINGNPAVWGDGALGLVQSSGLMEWIEEDNLDDIKKNKKATCKVKRRGDPVVKTVTFSYQDAMDAGIYTRGVWKSYPHRMCLMRARAFALRDKFADVLKGLKIAEEVMDYYEPDPTPEQPRIAASIVVPRDEPTKPMTDAQFEQRVDELKTEAATQTVEAEKPATITVEQAKEIYRAYSKSGWLPDEFKPWLVKNYQISDSRQLPPEHLEAVMAWAATPKPQPEENMDAEPTEQWTGELPEDR